MNRWVFVNGAFHLGAVHVFTGAQNHVFHAVFHVHVTVGVKTTQVTRAQPTINDGLGRCIGAVPVTTNEHWAKEPNFARLPCRHWLQVFVTNFHHHRPRCTTRAGWMRQIVRTGDGRTKRIGFGHAVTQLRVAVLYLVVYFANKRRWRRCSATAHCAQARGVVLFECR